MKVIYYTVLMIIFAAGSALAASGSIEFVNRWPETSPNVITSDGSYIYHGDGEVISVYDAADLTLVSRVTIPLTPAADLSEDEVAGTEGISGVFYDNGYLYVTCGSEGLRIYDVPAAPDVLSEGDYLSSYPINTSKGNRGFAKDVCVADGYAYVVYSFLTTDGYDSGIWIIDVGAESGTPQDPEFISEGQLETSFIEIKKAQSVVVAGDYAYVTDMINGLAVFDVTDKQDPWITAYCNTSNALDVAVHGDYAYLACAGSGVKIINVAESNFGNGIDYLVPDASCVYLEDNTKATAIEVTEDFVFVGDTIQGLVVLDNSSPAEIDADSWVNVYRTDADGDALSGVYRLYYDENSQMAYVGDNRTGLVQIDASDAANELVKIADAETPADGDSLYIDVDTSYVYIVDDDPTAGEFKEGLRILFAVQSENYVSFLLKGSLMTQGEARDVMAEGKYVYVADGSDGLKIIDPDLPPFDEEGNRKTKEPVFPELTGAYGNAQGFTGDASGVYVNDGYAYVAARNGGLKIIDVSEPESPYLSGENDTEITDAKAVFVDNETAYVADGENGLSIMDVSDKSNPSLLANYYIPDSDDLDDIPGNAWDVTKVGELVYVAAYNEGLCVFDVSDPENPEIAGEYGAVPYDFVQGVYAARSDEDDTVDLLWVANGLGGENMGFFANPETVPPQRIVGYRSTGDVKDVMVIEDYAFIADGGGGIQALGVQHKDEELGDWYYDVTPVDLHDSSDSDGCFIDSVFAPVTKILSRGW